MLDWFVSLSLNFVQWYLFSRSHLIGGGRSSWTTHFRFNTKTILATDHTDYQSDDSKYNNACNGKDGKWLLNAAEHISCWNLPINILLMDLAESWTRLVCSGLATTSSSFVPTADDDVGWSGLRNVTWSTLAPFRWFVVVSMILSDVVGAIPFSVLVVIADGDAALPGNETKTAIRCC